MAKDKRYINGSLTYAEQMVLSFLANHKGERFTDAQLAAATNIHVHLILDITRSLRAKGYEVVTSKRSGKHEFYKSTWKGHALLFALAVVIASLFFFATLDYLDEEPITYNVERVE